MNSKTNLLMAVLMAGTGIALIVLHNRVDILSWISVLIGIMFIIPSLFSLGLTFFSGNREDRSSSASSIIASIGGLGLGVAMCIVPGTFAGIFVYVFAAILVVAGLWHIVFITWLAKPAVMPGWFYAIPVLLVIAGVAILFTSIKTINNVVVLITGIAFICSAVNSILELVATRPSATRRLTE